MTGSSNNSFELHAGALRLAVRPDLGGTIAGLWHRDEPILRSTEPGDLTSPRLGASYPMVPYSNRLGYRRFRWNGKDYTTAPNFDDSPHSLHGVAWQRAWNVISSGATELVLAYTHVPDEHWPFRFEVEQTFTLTPSQCGVRLVLTNTHDAPVPGGVGWHPYFHRRERSRLHIDLTDRWDSDATQLPVGKHPQAGIEGDVSQLGFDNCFEGWTGPARVSDEKFSMQVTSSLPYLVVYTPAEKPYYCVEPVSHVSDAIHRADPAAYGLRTLQPGESLDAWMKIDVSPA